MSGDRWRIDIRERSERVFPFDHAFQLRASNCECAWVCRSIRAAFNLVDRAEFFIAHPELDPPVGDVGSHIKHAVRQAGIGTTR